MPDGTFPNINLV
jgi:hypothetical protein